MCVVKLILFVFKIYQKVVNLNERNTKYMFYQFDDFCGCVVHLTCVTMISCDSTQDFESCIKSLQQMGYSCPELTAAKGASAGGLVVGAVCNRSPGLLKAAVLKVKNTQH